VGICPIWIPIALVLFGLLIFVIYVTRDKWKNWFRQFVNLRKTAGGFLWKYK